MNELVYINFFKMNETIIGQIVEGTKSIRNRIVILIFFMVLEN